MISGNFYPSITSFVLRWRLPWTIFITAIGFILVLMPSLYLSWRSIIGRSEIAFSFFEFFSGFKEPVAIALAILTIPMMFVAFLGKYAYPGWDLKKHGRPDLKRVLADRLYPTTSKGGFAYFSFLVIDLFASLIFFILVCFFSYAAKIN
jgi:hypothetical protein